jgi:hypothetical protein
MEFVRHNRVAQARSLNPIENRGTVGSRAGSAAGGR